MPKHHRNPSMHPHSRENNPNKFHPSGKESVPSLGEHHLPSNDNLQMNAPPLFI